MKTFIIGLALTFTCIIASAQEQKTTISNLSVVTTSAGQSAQLTWKKGTENISYFVVEKSTDGIDFKQCGIVFLSDDPEFTEYKFRDKINVAPQTVIYRIGIVTEQNRIYYLTNKKLAVTNG